MKAMTSSFKQVLLYGSGIALMKGISLLMLPFITHQLPAAEFGKLEIISSIGSLASVLMGLGLENALYRFVGGCKDERSREKIASQIFTLTLIIGFIMIPLGWFIAEWLDSYIPAGLTTYQLRLVLMMLALEGCIAVPLGWLRMQNYALTFFSFAVGRAVFHATLIVVMLLMGRGINGVLEAAVIAAILQSILLSCLQIKQTGLSLSPQITKQSLIYSLPIMASGLMAFSMNGLDRWVLAEISSLEQLAQFGIAAKFGLAVVLLLQPFDMWWMPKRFDVLYGENGQQKATQITCYGLSATMLIAIIVAISAPVAITYFLPETYFAATEFVVLLVVTSLFKEMTALINLGSYVGQTAYAQLGINAIAASTAFCTLWWWGNAFGVIGVLCALTLSQGLRLVMFYSVSQYLYRLPYPMTRIIISTLFCLSWLAISHVPWTLTERLVLLIIAPLTLVALNIKLKLLPRYPIKKANKKNIISNS